MQITETLSDGLKRSFKVVVPAADLATRVETELESLKTRVRINGFRPGKVPTAHLRRLYGQSVMAEVVQNAVNDANRQIVADKGLKLAFEPRVSFPEEEGRVQAVMDGKDDLDFDVALEILPEIEIKDHSGIALKRDVAEVSEAELAEALERMAKQNRSFTPRGEKAKAEMGDRVGVDFVGKIDGVPFDGGTGEDITVELGTNSFIPGFEEGLVGAGAGESRVVKATFPPNYMRADLAGKEATFDVTVKEIAAPDEVKIDDELARAFGMESLDSLKEAVKASIERDFAGASRQKLKRRLLDALDELYDFPLPPTLVDQEFDNVWRQVETDMREAGKTFADEGTSEDAARADYRRISERRVRLGLLLAEIGTRADIKIGDEEVTQALVARARQYPGQEKAVWDYYRKNPQALAELRAPIYEEKVVDHLIAQVKVEDTTVSKEQLLADDEDEAGTG
jgi:trigger factor